MSFRNFVLNKNNLEILVVCFEMILLKFRLWSSTFPRKYIFKYLWKVRLWHNFGLLMVFDKGCKSCCTPAVPENVYNILNVGPWTMSCNPQTRNPWKIPYLHPRKCFKHYIQILEEFYKTPRSQIMNPSFKPKF